MTSFTMIVGLDAGNPATLTGAGLGNASSSTRPGHQTAISATAAHAAADPNQKKSLVLRRARTPANIRCSNPAGCAGDA